MLLPLALLDSLPLLAMDLGANRPRADSSADSSARNVRPRGGKAGHTASEGEMGEVVKQIAKLSLSNAQSNRALEACVMETLKIPADSPYSKAYKEGTLMFSQAQEDLKKTTKDPEVIREKLVLPQVYAFNQMIVLLLKEKDLPLAELIAAETKKWDPKMVASQIKHYQMSKMYGGANMKFKVSVPMALNLNPDIQPVTGISPAWVWCVLKKHLLQQKGVSLMQGRAPPGDLERQIQMFLDK